MNHNKKNVTENQPCAQLHCNRTNSNQDSGKIEIDKTSKYHSNEVTERLTDVGKNKQSTKNNTAKITKRTRLLANIDIKRWYDNLARGSHLTAEGRLRRLGRFCEVHDMTPISLADLAMKDLRVATDLL